MLEYVLTRKKDNSQIRIWASLINGCLYDTENNTPFLSKERIDESLTIDDNGIKTLVSKLVRSGKTAKDIVEDDQYPFAGYADYEVKKGMYMYKPSVVDTYSKYDSINEIKPKLILTPSFLLNYKSSNNIDTKQLLNVVSAKRETLHKYEDRPKEWELERIDVVLNDGKNASYYVTSFTCPCPPDDCIEDYNLCENKEEAVKSLKDSMVFYEYSGSAIDIEDGEPADLSI